MYPRGAKGKGKGKASDESETSSESDGGGGSGGARSVISIRRSATLRLKAIQRAQTGTYDTPPGAAQLAQARRRRIMQPRPPAQSQPQQEEIPQAQTQRV